MINKVVLVGRITKDPELRKTSTGISTVGFTLACNRRVANAQGGHDADFINCVAWRQSADFMANYVKKGALLGVEGRIQTRNYKDQSDRTVYVTEVVCDSVQILESKKENTNTVASNEQTQTNTYGYQESAPETVYSFLNIYDDDLPF